MNNTDKYVNIYTGKSLLEKHSLDEYGIWQIYGEDPNCDFAGHHYSPYLRTIEGKLRDVIAVAVDLDRFWTWGAGGEIKKIEVETAANLLAKIDRKPLIDKIVTRLSDLTTNELQRLAKELQI